MASSLITRAAGKARRMLARNFVRRAVAIDLPAPIVSFTFDDAPVSAFRCGGDILKAFDARATYFVSLGLLDRETEVGKIGSCDDLARAVEAGDELGCHAFDHLDAWHMPAANYIASVARNRDALGRLLPGARFESFAYPKSGATLPVKPALARLFACCRGGGQSFNAGRSDLNLLNACFIDARSADIGSMQRLIDENAAANGWLIFVTHDVSNTPSPYGCSPGFFQRIVAYASQSGADFLPVREGCARLRAAKP